MARDRKVEDVSAKEKAHDSGPGGLAEPLDNGYQDVTDALEQSKKDLAEPVEVGEDGVAVYRSEAAAALQDEQTKRASGSGEGGGRWPAETLVKNFVEPRGGVRPAPEYTSHEQD